MRGHLPSYELRAPRDLAEALSLLAEFPGAWRPFAGGTDLMVLLDAGALPAGGYISLWGLDELRHVDVTAAEVTLGAMTTYADVLRHPLLQAEFPLLCRAAAETGGVATQNRGTLGGNIANASPAADTPPALLVYDAELELASVRGIRRVPYHGFHTAYKQTRREPDELIRSIVLPRGRSGWIEAYRKVGTRRAQAISKVCFAAAVRIEDRTIADARVALGSVAPTVVRCARVEAVLRKATLGDPLAAESARAMLADVHPIDDVRSTATYRRTVAQNLVADFARSLPGYGLRRTL